MKKLFFAIIVLMSTTAQAQVIKEIRNLSNQDLLFTLNSFNRVITPKGIIETTIEITSNITVDVEIKNIANEKRDGHVLNFDIETPPITINLVKNKKETFKIAGIDLISGIEYDANLAFKFIIPGSASVLSGYFGGGLVTIPDVRKMVVFNTTSVTPSQIVLESKITTPNIDDVISQEIFDANGNSLVKFTETIFATVDAITFTKSFVIDLTLYPTASNLVTTSSTGGSQKMKLKSAISAISTFTSEGLTDGQIIKVFYSNGASQDVTWGEGKYISNRLSTIMVDGQLEPNIPIFIR